MFRLTKEHIGKKVKVIGSSSLKWLIPISFNKYGNMNEQVVCLKNGTIGEASETPLRNVEGHRWEGCYKDWEFYEEPKELFDFTQFGCNAEIVKKLIKTLDERYVHQKNEEKE